MSKLNIKASWNSDTFIGEQNYENQSLFDMLLNNGNENITLPCVKYGILQSGARSGYQTFWPSNKMHENIPRPDEPTGNIYSFHHLFVAYPNNQQRTTQYLNGN